MTRVALVEDHLRFANVAVQRINRLRDPATGQRASLNLVLDHASALARRSWDDVDVALVDAYRHIDDLLADRSLPLFAGLDIADQIGKRRPRVRVIGYSTRARWPEVNIAFRQVDGVAAVYDQAALVDNFAEAIWSDTFDHQVEPPLDVDFELLGVAPGSDLWAAIQAMRRVRPRDCFPHGDAWERVVLTAPAHKMEPRTNEYIKDRIGPLLGITGGHGRHREITAVIRRVVRPTAPLEAYRDGRGLSTPSSDVHFGVSAVARA